MVNLKMAARYGAVILGFMTSQSSLATSMSSQVRLTARYQVTCAIAGVDKIQFGTFAPGTSSQAIATGTLLVSCNGGTPFGVWSPLSANASANQRRMVANDSSGTRYLSYNLFTNFANSVLMPTSISSSGFIAQSAAATGWVSNYSATNISLQAVMPAGQNLISGHYSDIIVINVSY